MLRRIICPLLFKSCKNAVAVKAPTMSRQGPWTSAMTSAKATLSHALSYKHQNIDDDQLSSFLATQVLSDLSSVSPTSGQVLLDFSFNCFTNEGLAHIINFMEVHEEVGARVGFNQFDFPEFYKVASDRLHSEWIESGRLSMGTKDARLEALTSYQDRVSEQSDRRFFETSEESKRVSKRMERLSLEAAEESKRVSKQMERLSLEAAEESKRLNKQMERLSLEASEESKRLSKKLEKVYLTSKNLSDWGAGQRQSYEQLTCGALKLFLQGEGYTDILIEEVDKYRKTGFFVKEDGFKVNTVQWDGMILCRKGDEAMVFLLEAKKTSSARDMLTLPGRLNSAQAFIEACSRKLLPEAGRPQPFVDLCIMWSRCSGRLIRGVLAADIIPPSAMAMCHKEGYLAIQISQGMFSVADCAVGSSITVTEEDANLALDEEEEETV